MKKTTASIPNELREISDEDELVVSSIRPRQINQSLKSWVGSVKIHSWTDLPKCMKFIAKNGCTVKRGFIWAQRTLDHLSSTATPEQLIHILNGYADLHKVVLYFIKFKQNMPIGKKDICTFGGTASNIEQQKRHRNLVFIMHDTDNVLFAPLYTTHTDGHPQTCFATDDGRIIEDVVGFLHHWNQTIPQCSAQEIEHTTDDNDSTTETEESQNTNDLNVSFSEETGVQKEAVLTTSQLLDNDNHHTARVAAQLSFHPNDVTVDTNLKNSMTNSHNLSDTDVMKKNVHQHLNRLEELLNQARRLRGEVEDISSVESDDHQPMTIETVEEHESISQSGMTNISKSIPVHKKKHVQCSSHNRALSPICSAPNTAEPTPIMISTDPNMRVSVEQDEPPNITKQPKPYRRVRMLTDLAKSKCSLIQAGEGKSQRSYPEIEVSPDRNQDFCVSVKAVTENKYPHPLTTVAPENASVDWTLKGEDNNERVCLKYDPESFNAELACVYLPITDKERKKRSKQIKVRLLNWKQFGPMLKEVVERENPQLCRLELHWCKRVGPGKYQLVSRPSYTTVIEQENGDVFICSDKIEPKQLCELGGERVIIPLSTVFLKKDFSIECNDDVLKSAKFTVKRKQLLFTSPPKPEGKDELHLIIKRKEYIKNTATLEEYELHEDYLPYVTHDSDKCRHR